MVVSFNLSERAPQFGSLYAMLRALNQLSDKAAARNVRASTR
jgi:hypothetical protein